MPTDFWDLLGVLGLVLIIVAVYQGVGLYAAIGVLGAILVGAAVVGSRLSAKRQ